MTSQEMSAAQQKRDIRTLPVPFEEIQSASTWQEYARNSLLIKQRRLQCDLRDMQESRESAAQNLACKEEQCDTLRVSIDRLTVALAHMEGLIDNGGTDS